MVYNELASFQCRCGLDYNRVGVAVVSVGAGAVLSWSLDASLRVRFGVVASSWFQYWSRGVDLASIRLRDGFDWCR